MESSQWTGNNTLQLKDRFKHIICVIVQLYKVEGNNWRELTKDFVLMHMYYDQETQEVKLVAIDGIKVSRRCCIKVALRLSRKLTCQLIIKGFVISDKLRLVRPTKKFLHFISSKQGRSEMYGFGFQHLNEIEQFFRLFVILQKRLHLSSRTTIQSGFEHNSRYQPILSTISQSPYLPSQSTSSAPNRDAHITPLFSLNDSSWRNVVSQGDVTVDVQQIEKELQGLSLVSDASVTAPNFNSAPSVSRQTSVDAASSFHLDSNPYVPLSAEQQQYQLWSTSPWNNFLEQPVYNNQASITSTWDSLLNRESKNASEV